MVKEAHRSSHRGRLEVLMRVEAVDLGHQEWKTLNGETCRHLLKVVPTEVQRRRRVKQAGEAWIHLLKPC